jgi:hypothetical protein
MAENSNGVEPATQHGIKTKSQENGKKCATSIGEEEEAHFNAKTFGPNQPSKH